MSTVPLVVGLLCIAAGPWLLTAGSWSVSVVRGTGLLAVGAGAALLLLVLAVVVLGVAPPVVVLFPLALAGSGLLLVAVARPLVRRRSR